MTSPLAASSSRAARAAGSSQSRSTTRRDAVTRLGATDTIDPTADGVPDLEVDAFIDATGVAAAVVAGIRAVRPGGSVVLVGMGADTVALPIPVIQNRELKLTGVFRYTGTWPVAIHLAAAGLVDLDSMVTGRFPLDETEHALRTDHEPGSLKSMVVPR